MVRWISYIHCSFGSFRFDLLVNSGAFRLYSPVLLGQPAVDTPGTEKETNSGVTWTPDGVEVGLFCCGCSDPRILFFEDHTVEIYKAMLNIYPP